ncbi:MAG: serine/threonine protein kinase [Planctomycetaceae bacterium]|nr:serine/threonine protein kinase [Planctomycetaceae bacterium]
MTDARRSESSDNPGSSPEASSRSPLSVEELVEQTLARQKAGEAVSMGQLIADYPALADQIRDVWPALEALQSLSSDWKQSVSRKRTGMQLPCQLGPYRLEREIGRGGMGVVYEAQHGQLQRRVAVKVLSGQAVHADKGLERFLREARSAARLHHTNIIPVFNFGEQDGLYFIAMQLIRGAALDRVIGRLRRDGDLVGADAETSHNLLEAPAEECDIPDYGTDAFWRFVASAGVQAAQAVHYAHSQSTIHRDLKPANLLLDQDGTVWIADFGLAMQSDTGHWSQTNSLAGTLRYLSPEQFQGTCNEASDQYGLGVTLYELLTLKAATGDTTTQAEVMRAIAESRIATPRSVNAQVPIDLETIVMKAVSREPADRYADCGQLADDLQRFLEGRSVLARPPGALEQLTKWSRRNPLLAASICVSALSLLLVAGIAVVGYSLERQARLAEQQTELEKSSAIIKSRESLDEALDEFSGSGDSASRDQDVLSTSVLTPETAETLGYAFGLYREFVERAGASPEDMAWTIATRKRFGDFSQRLNDFEAATVEYEAALREWDVLVATATAEQLTSLRLTIAAIYNELGTCLLFLGQPDASARWHARAQSALEQLDIDSADVRYELARTHFLASRKLRPGESPLNSLSARANEPPDRSGRRPPRSGGPMPGVWRHLIPGRTSRPEPRDAGRFEMEMSSKQRTQLERAIALLETGAEAPSVRARFLLAQCYAGLSMGRFTNPSRQTEDAGEEADRRLSDLHEEYPDAPAITAKLAELLAEVDTRSLQMLDENTLREIEDRLADSMMVSQELLVNHPFVPDYKFTLVHTHSKMAAVLESRSRRTFDRLQSQVLLMEAVTEVEESIRLQTQLAKRYPQATGYQQWLLRFEGRRTQLLEQLMFGDSPGWGPPRGRN